MILTPFTSEQCVDIRRAVREHVEAMQGHLLQAVEAGRWEAAQTHADDIRRHQAILEILRRQPE